MASIVPKIKIGLAAGKREKHNLSFDCSTTSNIGSVQPTMCREMVPNSKYKVRVSSLVRLASMPLPTFGRMSLRHYHTFVPYVDLYQPFDALMSGQHYKGTNSATFIPSKVPYFTMADILPFILSYSDISIAPANALDKPYYITSSNVSYDGTVFYWSGMDPEAIPEGATVYTTFEEAWHAAVAHDLEAIKTAYDAVRLGTAIFDGSGTANLFALRSINSSFENYTTDEYGHLNFGAFNAFITGSYDSEKLVMAYPGATNPSIFAAAGGQTVINYQGADLITLVNGYYLLFKFKPFLKRLRTIFIGLGYQFSPYNTEEMSALKLLAYYKAWFNLFCPVREKAFVDTDCYWIIKRCSEINGSNIRSGTGSPERFTSFIKSLATECYYYLPMDYFSMAVTKPDLSNQDVDFTLNAGPRLDARTSNSSTMDSTDNVLVRSSQNIPASAAGVSLESQGGSMSPLTLKLAFQMLKWANKNTVIGRSIRQYLKVHFGVDDVNAIDDGGVYRIGSSRTNVTISDVMSTAENEQGYLGEYGGKGIGYGDSETFDFTADKFGVWITLTAVVPESGYYQGYLKENRHLNRYQFFNPDFDSLGYQVLERGEVMDDYNCDSDTWKPHSGYSRTAAFGLVPRYSEYKVGRNIVNGDLSLVGLYNSMAPYTLDRRIAGGSYNTHGSGTLDGGMHIKIVRPAFVPSIVYDAFRRIDPTDHLGQYNRIFNYGGNDLDHFIIHNVFDVQAYMPMKSLSDSFDTVDSEDDGVIKTTHS